MTVPSLVHLIIVNSNRQTRHDAVPAAIFLGPPVHPLLNLSETSLASIGCSPNPLRISRQPNGKLFDAVISMLDIDTPKFRQEGTGLS